MQIKTETPGIKLWVKSSGKISLLARSTLATLPETTGRDSTLQRGTKGEIAYFSTRGTLSNSATSHDRNILQL
jgi:hypothetical protein